MYDMLGSEKLGWKKGPWSVEEDKLLCEYVSLHGEGRWSSVSKFTGLNRSGKSCRLRWVNYLKPGLKKGQLTPQEQAIIVELHAVLGNKWSTIAKYLAGRTDNEIKNYWRTHHKNKDRSSSSRRNKRQDYHKRRPKKLQLQPPPQQYHDDDNNVNNNNINHHEPNFSDITNFTTIEDDQYYNNDYLANYFMNNQEQYWGSAALEDEGLWISLWNLEDTEGHARCGTMHNQHTTNSNATSSFHDIYHHVR